MRSTVREIFIIGLDDDVGARHSLCVEPPVISGCKFKGQFIILIVIFADVHVIAIG